MGSDPAPPIMAKLETLRAQFESIEASLQDPEVLSDHRRVRDLSIRKAALAPVVEGYQRYRRLESEIAEFEHTIDAGEDPELVELASGELPDLRARARLELDEVKASLVNADDRRVGSIMLEVRAGTGGEEAGLWARDLLQMYERFSTRRGWSFELLDAASDGGLGGVRHAIASIRGEGVWIELAHEAGVHSVKRVPVTESQGRIHTSTATVAVLPEPEEVEVRIDWNDVTEHITTAQGPGGQNVNKVATAVHLIHGPTGIEVRMQESKSQAQNREKARRLLLARLHELERQRSHEERSAERRAQI
ncbi:MAG: PCRF domain-containing protein, partial [Phycisphaerales bacterium]|nr:PCRF domain-containing protein [Phycisphaerales bacterium]